MVAVICFLGQVSNVAHFWLVQHVVCAEHGELIHTDKVAHAQPAGNDLVDKESTDSVRAGTESSDSAEDDHDHCLAVSERRKSCTVAPTTWKPPSPPLVEEAVSIAASPLRVSLIPDLQLAPKTSPPA